MANTINNPFVFIAIDGSISSQVAATYAAQLAAERKARLQGLYVVNEHYILDDQANYQPELNIEETPNSRAELVSWFRERGEFALQWLETLCQSMNVACECDMVFGDVAGQVLENAKDAWLAALGKKGFHHPEDPSHLGGNFQRIVHQMPVPFIAGGMEIRPLKRVLLGCCSGPISPAEIQWAERLEEVFQVKTYVISNTESARESDLTRQNEQLIQASHMKNVEWIAKNGHPVEDTVQVTAEEDIDLLIVGNEHSQSVASWFKENPLDRLLQQVTASTLVV